MISHFSMNIGQQLEQYTLKNPHEVLLVTIAVDGEEEEISIFKGFSSSLPAAPPTIPIFRSFLKPLELLG